MPRYLIERSWTLPPLSDEERAVAARRSIAVSEQLGDHMDQELLLSEGRQVLLRVRGPERRLAL